MQKKTSKRLRLSIVAALLLLIGCAVLLYTLFGNFLKNYRNNVANESASHLEEINEQIRLYVEEKIAIDWSIVKSVANSIDIQPGSNTEALRTLMQNERDLWGLTDICVYTESGFAIGADGRVRPNDNASDVVYYARKNGRYMSIIESAVTYTIPVVSELTVDGSPIAAVSIVQNLDSFIDNMGFRSFDGEAYVYLARSGGMRISQLTHEDALSVYNVGVLFEGRDVTCLTHPGESTKDALARDTICTFLYPDEGGDKYLVVTPVETGDERWRLYYFVPEKIVNRTMNTFSTYVTTLSFTIIGVFAICGTALFAAMYRTRKTQFDQALDARDRMLDLLVANTRYAFAILSTERRAPAYLSPNFGPVLKDASPWLQKTERGYRITPVQGTDGPALDRINGALARWNGQSEIETAYLPREIDGITRYFVLHLYPIQADSGEAVAIAQDVTQDREREETLRSALAIADSASLAKSRFLANMSHDIRTPMNAIVNVTDFAIESVGEPEKQLEYLETVRNASQHLLRLINDILDMSRIESGKAVVAAEPFVLTQCLNEAVGMTRPLARAKQQTLFCDFSGVTSDRLIGDPLKLSRIVLNLLNNAVKFTGNGGHIRFTVVEMASLLPENAALRFTVADDGMGIAPEDLETIFDPFSRTENAEVRRIEGSGLGLPICKSYIMAMGGTIRCESEVGKGSSFIVELFFQKDAPLNTRDEVATKTVSFAGKRALLCEDNVINQMIAGKLLERHGFTVDCTADGREVMERFCASAPGTYDIIYMDIQMPVMNGYDATAAIRGSAHPQAKTIPIVAMTANVFAEDAEKARASGMNGHLGKPLNPKELFRVTQQLLEEEKAEEA